MPTRSPGSTPSSRSPPAPCSELALSASPVRWRSPDLRMTALPPGSSSTGRIPDRRRPRTASMSSREPTTPLVIRKAMMNEGYDRSMTTTTEASEFVSLLKSLRAVRQFTDKPLPSEAIRDMHDVIRWSGNASNRQEFQVLWVEDRAKLRQLSELKGYARHLAGAAAGAVIVTWMQSDVLNAFDEGRIAGRTMLAAPAYGIRSSIGMLSAEPPGAAQKILDVAADRVVRTPISLGYPAAGALRGGRRKPLAELVNPLR